MFVSGLELHLQKYGVSPGHWDIMTVAMTIGVVFLGTIVAFSCYLHGISMLGPVQEVCLDAWNRWLQRFFPQPCLDRPLNDRCCWNLMYCWSSDGIDGRGCVIRHYGFVFEGKKGFDWRIVDKSLSSYDYMDSVIFFIE